MESSLLIGDIPTLSDEDLYGQLTAFGVIMGPIVGTTRKTYERKLAILMGGEVLNSSFNDSSAAAHHDSDVEVEPSVAYISRQQAGSEARRRRAPLEPRSATYNDDDDEVEEGQDEQPSAPLYTPSPRPPLRSATEGYRSYQEESYLSSPSQSPYTPPSADASLSEPLHPTTGFTSFVGVVMKLSLAVFVIAIIAYYVLDVSRAPDAFEKLETLAKVKAKAAKVATGGQ